MKINRPKMVKYAGIFLLVMLLFTLISNKVNFLMTPEVSVVNIGKGRLKREITAKGRMENGKVMFSMNLEKEPYINVHDRMTAKFSNIQERLEIVVEEKAFDESTQLIGYACRFDKSPQENVYDGQECTVRFDYEIGSYDIVMPKECVIMEGRAYVYRLDTIASVTGESTIARKIEVSIVAEDDFNVAVSGGLNAGSCVVRYFTKPLRNEQKVRVTK